MRISIREYLVYHCCSFLRDPLLDFMFLITRAPGITSPASACRNPKSIESSKDSSSSIFSELRESRRVTFSSPKASKHLFSNCFKVIDTFPSLEEALKLLEHFVCKHIETHSVLFYNSVTTLL